MTSRQNDHNSDGNRGAGFFDRVSPCKWGKLTNAESAQLRIRPCSRGVNVPQGGICSTFRGAL